MATAPAFSPRLIGIIVGRDLIGDALIKLPFARALRAAFPNAEIHWITSQGPTAYGDALRDITKPLIDFIDERPAWLPTRERATNDAAPAFDLLLDTRGKLREALRVRPLAKGGIFIAPAFRYLLSDKRPPLWQKRPKKMIDRLMQMLERAAGYVPPASGRLGVSEEDLAKAQKLLPDGKIYIGLAPGAGNKIKAWPLENFIEVARDQVAKGRIPVFLLGPQESDWHEKLGKEIPEALFPLQAQEIWGEKIRIEHTLALAMRLTLAVTNDSGTSHMLAAMDCPLISLFGPTSADKLAPRVSHGIVLRAQSFGGEEMTLIPTESVIKSIDEAILLLKLA
jgi:ADP-heptose:LPS heptosyltransferase